MKFINIFYKTFSRKLPRKTILDDCWAWHSMQRSKIQIGKPDSQSDNNNSLFTHNVVSANGAVIDNNIPSPKGNCVPFLYFKSFLITWRIINFHTRHSKSKDLGISKKFWILWCFSCWENRCLNSLLLWHPFWEVLGLTVGTKLSQRPIPKYN